MMTHEEDAWKEWMNWLQGEKEKDHNFAVTRKRRLVAEQVLRRLLGGRCLTGRERRRARRQRHTIWGTVAVLL